MTEVKIESELGIYKDVSFVLQPDGTTRGEMITVKGDHTATKAERPEVVLHRRVFPFRVGGAHYLVAVYAHKDIENLLAKGVASGVLAMRQTGHTAARQLRHGALNRRY